MNRHTLFCFGFLTVFKKISTSQFYLLLQQTIFFLVTLSESSQKDIRIWQQSQNVFSQLSPPKSCISQPYGSLILGTRNAWKMEGNYISCQIKCAFSGRISSLKGWLSFEMGCPGEWWSHHSWKRSRNSWMWQLVVWLITMWCLIKGWT